MPASGGVSRRGARGRGPGEPANEAANTGGTYALRARRSWIAHVVPSREGTARARRSPAHDPRRTTRGPALLVPPDP